MHAHKDSQAADQEALHVSALSPCSSSSSSSSFSASVVPLSFSPVPSCSLRWRYGESLMALGLRFTELDWKEVEKRFNRLASIRNNRTEPVVKWSDFGLTVGMKQSAEIANEILRALRGRREWKDDITKNELEGFWVRMNDSCIHSRIRLFFDMYVAINGLTLVKFLMVLKINITEFEFSSGVIEIWMEELPKWI